MDCVDYTLWFVQLKTKVFKSKSSSRIDSNVQCNTMRLKRLLNLNFQSCWVKTQLISSRLLPTRQVRFMNKQTQSSEATCSRSSYQTFLSTNEAFIWRPLIDIFLQDLTFPRIEILPTIQQKRLNHWILRKPISLSIK